MKIGLFLLAMCGGAAFAQQVYKCSNIYSEKPCASDAKKIEIKPALGIDCSQIERKYTEVCKNSTAGDGVNWGEKNTAKLWPRIKQLSFDSIDLHGARLHWAMPFPVGASKLPANYMGLDGREVYKIFKANALPLTKGDFEKEEEFLERYRNTNVDLSPLSSNVEYAVRLDFHVSYDPDGEKYIIKNSITDCNVSRQSEGNKFLLCNVATSENGTRTYIGSNAFGAKVDVLDLYSKHFAIAIPVDSVLVKKLFIEEGYGTKYSFVDKFSFPIEAAKSLKQNKIGVLFVGRFTTAEIIKGVYGKIATISSPVGTTTEVEAVPFKPTRVIYYVVNTGEILSRKEF
jgi:hypothetical protein